LNGIGLFGGTFNPIHKGHLKVAREVKTGFDLEKIYFIPCALPPHKETATLADAEDRLCMIHAAIEGDDDFVVSEVEIRRKGLSYSVDTVTWFKGRLLPDRRCFLIMGMDAFVEIDTWKSFEQFFEKIPIIVMTRPAEQSAGLTPSSFESRDLGEREELEHYIQNRVDSEYVFVRNASCFVHPEKQPVYLFHVAPVAISSTEIRERVRTGRKISGLVPAGVEKYILEKGLYV